MNKKTKNKPNFVLVETQDIKNPPAIHEPQVITQPTVEEFEEEEREITYVVKTGLTTFQKLSLLIVSGALLLYSSRLYNEHQMRSYLVCQNLWKEWQPQREIFKTYDPNLENLYTKINNCTKKLYGSEIKVGGQIPEHSNLAPGNVFSLDLWQTCKVYFNLDPHYYCA